MPTMQPRLINSGNFRLRLIDRNLVTWPYVAARDARKRSVITVCAAALNKIESRLTEGEANRLSRKLRCLSRGVRTPGFFYGRRLRAHFLQ